MPLFRVVRIAPLAALLFLAVALSFGTARADDPATIRTCYAIGKVVNQQGQQNIPKFIHQCVQTGRIEGGGKVLFIGKNNYPLCVQALACTQVVANAIDKLNPKNRFGMLIFLNKTLRRGPEDICRRLHHEGFPSSSCRRKYEEMPTDMLFHTLPCSNFFTSPYKKSVSDGLRRLEVIPEAWPY